MRNSHEVSDKFILRNISMKFFEFIAKSRFIIHVSKPKQVTLDERGECLFSRVLPLWPVWAKRTSRSPLRLPPSHAILRV